jgi:hypothetical protein
MAAPQLGIPRYADGSVGQPLTATALRSKLEQGAVQWLTGGTYRETSTNRTFTLLCARCRHNQCAPNSQRIRKLGQTWTGKWASFFVHNTLRGHTGDCICKHGASAGGGNASRQRRFLEHRVFIPTKQAYHEGNLPLLLEYSMPNTRSTYLKKWFQTQRVGHIDHFELVPRYSLPDDVLACGKVTHHTLNRTAHDFDTMHPVFLTKNLNFRDLEFRCWHLNFEGIAAEPLPVKVDHEKLRVRIEFPQNTSNKFYFAAAEDDEAANRYTALPVDAPVFGKHLLKLNDDFPALLDLFEKACQAQGYALEFNDPKMDFRLFDHDRKVRFLYINNRANEDRTLDLRALEVGSIGSEEISELTADEYLGDFVGDRESRQFKEIRVPANTTLLKRLEFSGHVRFEVHMEGRLLFTDIVNAGPGVARISVDESTALLRSEFISLVRATYPEFQPLPLGSEDDEIELEKMDWVDFDRFMFSRTLRRTGDETVAPQGVTLRNSLLLKLLTSFNEKYSNQLLEDSTTLGRFSEMFESNYEPVVDEMLEDELGDLTYKTKHRLVETEAYGWFGPDASEYKWLVDRRAWCQLIEDNPGLTPGDLVFLPSGHRLIRASALGEYDQGRIEQLDRLAHYPTSPDDTLERAFEFTTTGEANRKYVTLEKTVDNGADEYVFNMREHEQQRFSIWSNRDFADPLADGTPWDRHGEPCLVGVNGFHYAIHRLTWFPHEDLMTHGFYIVRRQEGTQAQAIRFFRSSLNARPDPISEATWMTMTHQQRVFARWQTLRTLLRAFSAASLDGTLPLTDFETWKPLLDFSIRNFLFSRQGNPSPLDQMDEHDSQLSQHIKAYMLKCMWIE